MKTFDLISWNLGFLIMISSYLLTNPLTANIFNPSLIIFEQNEDSLNTKDVIFESSGGHFEIGDDVCVDITTRNFVDIDGYYIVLHWDSTLLEFNRYDFTDALLTNENVNIPDSFPDYVFTVFLYDSIPKTLMDDSKILTVCFKAKANGRTKISFPEAPNTVDSLANNPHIEILSSDEDRNIISLGLTFIEQEIIIGEQPQLCALRDSTFECRGQLENRTAALNWNLENLNILSNCSSSDCEILEVISDFDFNNLENNCGLTGSIITTYTIINNCGDSLKKKATFTIKDESFPILTREFCSPTSMVVLCTDSDDTKKTIEKWHEDNLLRLMYCMSDLCTAELDVSSDFNPNDLLLDCNEKKLSVEYTVSDECDNTITFSVIIKILIIEKSTPKCEDITIQSTDSALILSKLQAPNTIVKVFDPNWQTIYTCVGDCPKTISISSDLVLGATYHVDIQFYDENWQFICDLKDDILFCNAPEDSDDDCQTALLSCENVQVYTEKDQIIIDGLTAANEIVKVFDKDYNILYECFANCEERQIAGIFPEGDYIIDLQLYDAHWGVICTEQRPLKLEFKNGFCNGPNCAGKVGSRYKPKLIESTKDIILSPNPAMSETYINISQLKGKAVTLNLYDQFGRSVWSKHIEQVQQDRERIDLTNFQNGLYFLKIQTPSRKLIVKKMMISKLY
jgi:hypothetical protein